MSTIIRRKDNSSICCSSINQRHNAYTGRTRVLGFTIASILLVIGLFIFIIAV